MNDVADVAVIAVGVVVGVVDLIVVAVDDDPRLQLFPFWTFFLLLKTKSILINLMIYRMGRKSFFSLVVDETC